MAALYALVWHILLMSILTAAILAAHRWMWRRLRPLTVCVVCIILLAGMIIPFRPAFPSLFEVSMPAEAMTEPTRFGLADADKEAGITGGDRPESAAQAPQTQSGTSNPSAPAEESPERAGQRRLYPILLLWLSGCLCTTLAHAWWQIRFHRMNKRWRTEPTATEREVYSACARQASLRRKPALWRCACIRSPMLVGLFRPVVLIPDTGMPAQDLQVVFAHELTHYRQRHLWIKLLGLCAVCLHWYNPLVWRLAHTLSITCEMACDAAVLRQGDSCTRLQYGNALLRMISSGNPRTALSTDFSERRYDMKYRFQSILSTTPKKTGGLFIALLLLLTMLTGSVLAVVPEPDNNLSPTTGLPYSERRGNAYKPVLVHISNQQAARPALNLSEADVVYERIYWGPGHTRFLAVYNDRHPVTVGPLRGARVFDTSLRQAWGGALFFWGGQELDTTNIHEYFVEHDVPSSLLASALNPNYQPDAVIGKFFSRDPERVNPHNAIANISQYAQSYWPTDPETEVPYTPHHPGLYFSDAYAKGDQEVSMVELYYDFKTNHVRWIFNPETQQYERYQGNTQQFDGITGKPIVCDNLILQCVDFYAVNYNPAQLKHRLTGTGPILVCIDGKATEGNWYRPGEDDPYHYLTAGMTDFQLKPGKTFIQIVPPRMFQNMTVDEETASLTYTNEEVTPPPIPGGW